MVKLLDLVSPKTLQLETEEKQLPEAFTIRERGLEFLKQRLEILNKKAAKYKVPPLVLKIDKEELVKELHPDIKRKQKINPDTFDKTILDNPNSWVLVKEYTVQIEGNPPQVEGYEFIARLEHTPAGNYVFTNPKSSVPNLPTEYQTLNQRCDVCKTNRDRHDTFILRMEKDDPKRFPDKKEGDFLVIGRNCLAGFLPGISIAGLISFTKLVDSVREDIDAAKEVDNGLDGGGGSGKYYEDPEHLLRYLSAVYLHTGKYVSRKAAQLNADNGDDANSISTLSRALGEMRPNPWSKTPRQDYPIYYRLREDDSFEKNVQAMCEEFANWLSKKDFDALAVANPSSANFFNNMKLVAHEEFIKGNQFGFYAALFQLFLRDKHDLEKKVEAEKQAKLLASLEPSPIKFDETLLKKRLRDVAKDLDISRMMAQGMDEKSIKKEIRGKEYGWEVTVKKVTPYEKTSVFGGADDGIGYRTLFRDKYGNDFLWFASVNPFVEGHAYSIDGTIVGYEALNKYSNRPQTRINRVKIVKTLPAPTSEPPTSPSPSQTPAGE